MIPSIFREGEPSQGARRRRSRPGGRDEDGQHREWCGGWLHRRESAPAAATSSRVASSQSIALTGGPQLALAIYLAFYLVCLALTWWFYLRKSPETSSASSLAGARI